MMKKIIFPAVALIAIALAVMAFVIPARHSFMAGTNPPQEKADPVFPDNVQKILQHSCFDCHSDISDNNKALSKIDFSTWKDLSNAKKVAKMQDIIDMLSKGKMPPSQYVSKYPDRAPGKEEKDTLIKWANDESDKLMNK